jgi:Sap, sulfolipid-1-addressing protein
MLVLVALVVSVAVVDSINPSTLGPALLFAIGRHARRDVAAFTLGVFAVSTLGGLVLLFGPGRALLTVASRPGRHTVHLIELATGALAVGAACVLWLSRERIAQRLRQRERLARRRPALLLGAAIMAAELPTAFPYLGALAAVAEAHPGVLVRVLLVLTYNVLFVAPMLAVLGAVVASGERGAALAAAARAGLERYGPAVLPVAVAALGAVILVIGGAGLVRE